MKNEKDNIQLFCARCFASEKNSSFGCDIIKEHCFNCGAGGFVISIPEWAIDSIRSQASWVGKRHYAIEEDIETAEELKRLRATISVFNGRSVKQSSEDPCRWIISQKLNNGTEQVIFVSAESEEEALEKAKTLLPYVS